MISYSSISRRAGFLRIMSEMATLPTSWSMAAILNMSLFFAISLLDTPRRLAHTSYISTAYPATLFTWAPVSVGSLGSAMLIILRMMSRVSWALSIAMAALLAKWMMYCSSSFEKGMMFPSSSIEFISWSTPITSPLRFFIGKVSIDLVRYWEISSKLLLNA